VNSKHLSTVLLALSLLFFLAAFIASCVKKPPTSTYTNDAMPETVTEQQPIQPRAMDYPTPGPRPTESPWERTEADDTGQGWAQPDTTAIAIPPEPEAIWKSLGKFRVSFYCLCALCCGIWSQEHPSRVGTDYVQLTASGTVPTPGRTISADWGIIEPGTVVMIDGNEYVVEDRGGAVKGRTIDKLVDCHEYAIQKGIIYKEVYVRNE
jgi:3D (Asp-Asp-Asp) domain-containing protein